MVVLSKEERLRFAEWCEQEAREEDGLAQQMEKLNLPSTNHYRTKALAKALVAKDLRAIEEF